MGRIKSMTINRDRLSEQKTFWISLLFHTLILIAYLLTFRHVLPPREIPPALYVPSYVYQPSPPPAPAARPAEKQAPVQKQTAAEALANQEDSDFDLSHYKMKQTTAAESETALTETSLAQFHAAAVSKQHEPPVNMIGEKLLDDPLKKLLGIAITKHLYYPDAAQELNMHGVSAVGFTLYPDGTVTNVQIMHSSGEKVLDAAAAAAVNEMGPVSNVDIYVKKPRFLVVNIIFR